MNKLKRFTYYHLPAILYAVLIIVISSMQRLPTSRIGLIGADKIAHFFEYALFALLAFRSFSNIGPRVSLRMAVLLSFLFLVLFAVLDEYYQHLIPGRTADVWDLVADVVGASLVLLLLWLRKRSDSRSEAT